MDSIKIKSGTKRILVNEDPDRVISFNPSDVNFAERFYKLIGDFEEKSKEFTSRSEVIAAVPDLDEYGIPKNMQESLDLLKEICAYMREKIDGVFGAGTSQAAFGDDVDLDMFGQFFDGIKPFIEQARMAKISKYAPDPKTGRAMK